MKIKNVKKRNYAINGVAFSAMMLLVGPAFAVDSDGDGIDNTVDLAPCDNKIASIQAVPGENQFAMLVFEDQWPNAGDYDFNDFVVGYNVEIYRNAAGQATRLRLTYHPQAMGALFDNGFAVQLPISAAAASGATITRKIGNGSNVAVSSVAGESLLTLVAAQHIRNDLFAGVSGQINTDEAAVSRTGSAVEFNIVLANPVSLSTSEAPFDVFLFRNTDYSHQIHLPQYQGTSLMNASLKGTQNDRSTGVRAFVDEVGVPFALNLPVTASFPQEGRRIDALFPRITQFASSAGAQAQDFFSNGTNNAVAYRNARPAAPNIGLVSSRTDGTCLPPDGSVLNPATSCLTLLQSGQTNSGTYFIDPDGTAGLQTPIQVFCDMTNDGGGWTVFSPSDIGALKFTLNSYATNRSSVMFYLRRDSDGAQFKTLTRQLAAFSSIPIDLVHHTNTSNHVGIANQNFISTTFVPRNIANQRTVQGFISNDVDVAFTNCDSNPNSYFEHYRVGNGYSGLGAGDSGVSTAWRATKRNLNGNLLPTSFFAFTALHFGGCGVHSVSSAWGGDGISSSAVGIR